MLLKYGFWLIFRGRSIPRKPSVKSDQIKFADGEEDINFGLPFKVNSITLWPGEVSGFRQSAHFTHRPLYIIYPGFFTSTLILIFIARSFSCKTYDQHIESYFTSFLNLWSDLQKIICRWNTGCWKEAFVLPETIWVFPSFERQHWNCILEGEKGLYIGNLMPCPRDIWWKENTTPATSEQAVQNTAVFCLIFLDENKKRRLALFFTWHYQLLVVWKSLKFLMDNGSHR